MKDLNEFIDTGRFIPRQDFLAKRPNELLLDDCSDVIQYEGGHYIQVLGDATFYLDEFNSSEVLDEVELILYTRKIEEENQD
jgi:hypothetical protein